MIGLDSNLLIRYLAQDDPVQSAVATRLIEEELTEREPGYLTLVALAETVWVIVGSYGADRSTVHQAVEGLLSAPQVRVERAEQVWQALQAYAHRGDFSDALISELARDAGCRCTRTFDVAASRQPGFELLR